MDCRVKMFHANRGESESGSPIKSMINIKLTNDIRWYAYDQVI